MITYNYLYLSLFINRIEEFYTELYNNEQSTIIHFDQKEVPVITSWEVEAALRDVKNGTATGIENRRRYHLEDTC